MEVSDRRKAIKLAIKELKMNEILIVAGKGHEKFQVLKNKTIKFDDFTVVKQLLN
jgi:UDP-N-acetylmuramyl tripeptide synthase